MKNVVIDILIDVKDKINVNTNIPMQNILNRPIPRNISEDDNKSCSLSAKPTNMLSSIISF